MEEEERKGMLIIVLDAKTALVSSLSSCQGTYRYCEAELHWPCRPVGIHLVAASLSAFSSVECAHSILCFRFFFSILPVRIKPVRATAFNNNSNMSNVPGRCSVKCHDQHHARHCGLVVVSTCLLSIVAFILTLFVAFDCRFYQVTTTPMGHSMSIGLWKVQDMIRLGDNNDIDDSVDAVIIQQGGCVAWKNHFLLRQPTTKHHQGQEQQPQPMQLSDVLDGPMVAARSINALLFLTCLISPLWFLVSSATPLKCMKLSTTTIRCIVVGLLLTGVLSLCLLVRFHP
jgi:hypothetical protein